MSVRVMTAVWDIDLPDSEKIVLLALADCANDEGLCWPSMATLAKKCSKTDRTCQAAIRDLCAAGHLTRQETPGKGCRYWVHPRSDFTPEAVSPPKPFPQPPKSFRATPEAASDKPSKNHKQPSGGGAQARNPAAGLNENGKGKAGAGSAGATPRSAQDGDSTGQRLPDGWTAPAVDAVPPVAGDLVRQWPAGAFEASCETFRLHWTSATGKAACKRDWLAALGKWLISDHPKVMRDAKAGISFARLVPGKAGGAGKRAAPRSVKARDREDERSVMLRGALRTAIGDQPYAQWLEPCALIFDAPGLVVIAPSEFVRGWLEQHFDQKIRTAAGAIGGEASRWVRFEREQVLAKGSE